ncbi:MAG: hypothetical protein HZR80_14430 [Candidatus Heimdallarchaeota archaeon]
MGLSALFDFIDTSGLAFTAQYSVDYLLRFIRYSFLALILGLLMPWIFVKVKIFSKEKTELEEEPAVISSQA